ncbi:hypothetical protein MUN82_08650 [Hymenobacter aerilatus]|uniref:Uncharacterized protein n=1 Tax=Hymenobacter aerilatus TaxID=2932251 RepID=A0A8T9SY31_9BACT|nr:hypothetical protein [Hymenobacter aerilatus]UOR07152.1 hypothetical protein MUN82_08650 [Hymenobacter aerilatus]
MATREEIAPKIAQHINAILELALSVDAPTAAPTSATLAAIELEARPGLEDRSAGWKFEGIGYDGKTTLLATSQKVKSREKTKLAVKPGVFKEVKATYPKDSYGNMKLRFLDANGQVLPGTPSGPAGSYNGNKNATYEQVFTPDADKFYDAANGNSGVLTYTFSQVAAPAPTLSAPIAKPVATVDPTTGTILVSYK